MNRLHITQHAKQRIDQMGLDESRVLAVVANPDMTMPNDNHYPPGRKFVGDGLTVVVSNDLSILTVLWHLARGRSSDGGPIVDLELAS
jgi:hypothetical protein